MNRFKAALLAFKNPALVNDGMKVRQLTVSLQDGQFAIAAGAKTSTGEMHLRIIRLSDRSRSMIRKALPFLKP